MTRIAGLLFIALIALGAGAVAGPPAVPSASAQDSGAVNVEWLGWNFWRITSPTGKIVLLNPYAANPDSPISAADITRADLILVTNIHADEVGQAVEIAQRTGARVVSPSWDAGGWLLESGLPIAQLSRNSAGDRVRFEGITVRLTNGFHGSANPQVTEHFFHGGPPAAFMVTFENGWTVYYGGSTSATMDQALVAGMYRPDAAIVNMGGSREPMDFAAQVRLLSTDNPNLTAVFPGHHRIEQQGTTVAEVQAAMRSMGLTQTVTEPAIGVTYTYSK